MKYQVGQAVIYLDNGEPQLGFINNTNFMRYSVVNLADSHYTIISDDSRPATEAEILAEIQKHGWKQSNSKWLYASPSGQLELMNNDSWQPIIKRQPLPDQFEFFGNECIQAARIITALNLANV
jgi:hypothetical protein